MPTGARRPLTVSSGPTVGPRLVPPGGAFVASDQAPLTELRFLPLEVLAMAASSGEADGTGAMQAALQAPTDRVWEVERITVSTNATQPTSASVYVGTVDPANLADYTPAGNGDVADETNPVRVAAGQVLLVRWTGANAGAVGTVRIQGKAGSLAQVAVR